MSVDFPEALLEGVLIRRYQRFLADVRLADGCVVTAYTPNTGSMKGCCDPGSRVWLSDSHSATRKYPLTWELVETASGTLVGINTGLSNKLVDEAIGNGTISELQDYDRVRSEVRYGRENSRIDLLLQKGEGTACYVEGKNVTLVKGDAAYFPDAITIRGSKHLRELAAMREQGRRAVIFFCVQRADALQMRPADCIDPVYAAGLRDAITAGVEAYAYKADVTLSGIALRHAIPVLPERQMCQENSD